MRRHGPEGCPPTRACWIPGSFTHSLVARRRSGRSGSGEFCRLVIAGEWHKLTAGVRSAPETAGVKVPPYPEAGCVIRLSGAKGACQTQRGEQQGRFEDDELEDRG